MKTRMRGLFNRFVAIALVVACCTCSTPLLAFAEDVADSSGTTIDFEDALGETEDEDFEGDESGEDESGEDESDDEDAAPAETESTTVTGTVDEDGNVETESVEGEASDEEETSDDAEEVGDLSLETLSTDIASDGETETETTYSLSITVTTTATSSSDSSVRKVKVSKPTLTTTVTDAETGEVISSTTKTYELTVKCNVAGEGWSTATTSGSYYTFDAGSGKYVQSVRFSPSSSLTSAMNTAGLSFCYRAKTKYFGTLDWATPGASAGTAGNKCPLTGIELKVIDADEVSSLETTDRFISAPIVQYQTKTYGSSSWNSAKTNGSTSGGSSSAVGALKVKLSTEYHRLSGNIQYSVRSSTSDSSSKWTSWKSGYTSAGSSSNKLKAIRVKLTGDMAEEYNVYYRVYVKGYGWLGWAKNGEKAGTKGTGLAITAVQIKLVPKGQSAPGSTSNHYLSTSNAKLAMVVKAQSYTSSTKYLILVNRSTCRVGIFTGSKNNWKLKYYWECCVGKSSTPTPSGSYTVGIKEYSFGTSSYTCYYATQISGNYLFHSVLYYPGTFKVKDGTMGEAVSHGCVRLTLSHAKWIYNNIPTKTKVRIY